MGDLEIEEKIKAGQKAAEDNARLRGKVKLMWQGGIALLSCITLLMGFSWTGRGIVDDLKKTVTDNATYQRTRTDSLWLDHESKISSVKYDVDELNNKQQTLSDKFDLFLQGKYHK